MARVRGSGSIPADIAIVGESPGRSAAQFGHPFAGPLCRFVLPLILSMPSSVFLTNAVQVPRIGVGGRIRKTSKSDILEDLKFLREELGKVNPRVTIALGKIATDALFMLGEDPIILPHPRFARIRKNAWPIWIKLVKKTAKEVERLL